MKCEIEVFANNQWHLAAMIEVPKNEKHLGYRARCHFSYEVSYAAEFLEQEEYAVSAAYPVNFEFYNLPHWPAFLLDILPSGAGRRIWQSRLNLKGDAQIDWDLLIQGASNPSGNLRIRQAVLNQKVLFPSVSLTHKGFSYDDVLERGEDFIEYAYQHGAPVSGSSGAQGDAPKFLLVEDYQNRWHAEGAIIDEHIKQHWLVKFPRGKQLSDRQLLRNEQAYYEVARQVGLFVGQPLIHCNDTLFIPRFDRVIRHKQVLRYGLESLCSLAGVAEFGASLSQNKLAQSLVFYSHQKQTDLFEFIKRDVMNIALGNTDNHARNTAVLKQSGKVALSPLYDFAPMILDDQGISRHCRWEGNAEKQGVPEWGKVVEDSVRYLGLSKAKQKVKAYDFRQQLASFSNSINALPSTMAQCGVDESLIQRLSNKIQQTANALREVKPL